MSQPAPRWGRSVLSIGETLSMSVETFTIREAAEKCGVTYQAMRKRVDRGTLQTVKKEGVRRIPRSELERAGLWPGSTLADEELRKENEQHRQLTEQAQSTAEAERKAREAAEAAASQARAERLAAEQQASANKEKAEKLRAELEEVSNAGPIKAWRLRRQIKERLETAEF